ncbi:hypothetical protein ES706_02477 [subsurface metagenome]
MDPVVIGALIGAAGAIIAAFVSVWGRKQKIRANEEEKLKRKAILALGEKQDNVLDVYCEFDKILVNIQKDGNCSMKRTIKIVPTEQSKPIPDKKIILAHEGIDFYLSKTGKVLSQIDPDKEFGIEVRDVKNKVRLGSSTDFAGMKKERLVTNVIFDVPLTKDDPGEIEIKYSYLDVSFFWKKLWGIYQDEWCVTCSNPVKEYNLEILFPEVLPFGFRLTEIGVVLIPREWAYVKQDTIYKRKRLLLTASNLEVDKSYKLKIDMS